MGDGAAGVRRVRSGGAERTAPLTAVCASAAETSTRRLFPRSAA